ncbi:protein-ADP-ribose hydrolase [Brachyspira aalborgi]|uniref:Protein-ADP-ribose hydrolase n=1 Tax=Brachyspira aalborgi TaxID=29522 RepID=A0A5C8E155_9SPIR|nr:protein-ADP-ribose hydrolase [Brachyspira aalborgi]TXJ31557.1 protein-ADP-ribose hydrolase [Brachyspira aalborgi]
MEKLLYLINYLAKESKINIGELPSNEIELKNLFRSLMNMRQPNDISENYLKIEDKFLKEEFDKKLITNIENLKPMKNNLYIWKGDITTLKIDAIVNAANSAMLGCFYPMHKCIDNAIHSAAGTRLRLFCRDIINKSGGYLETGDAKITPAFNLPCKYVLHTVGPIIKDKVSKKDEKLLSLCYKSCLNLVVENNIESVAFCCISTGEFKFPNDLAVDIALSSVNDFLKENKERNIKIVFNVFKDIDYELYNKKIKELN